MEVASSGGYAAGVRAAMPLALPTLLVGVSFGALAQTLDWGLVAPVVASIIVFSASAQFAIASVLGAGGGAASAVVAAALVNARFLPMGASVAGALHGSRARRALEAQAVVDASWALASRGHGRFDREVLIGATIPQFVAWVAGTAIGVAAGSAIGDLETFGLDVLIPAFFVVLLRDELRNRRAVQAALLAAALTLVCVPILPAGLPVVVASTAALLGLWSR